MKQLVYKDIDDVLTLNIMHIIQKYLSRDLS